MDFESWYLANKKRQLLALKEVSTKTGYGLELIVIYIMGINVIILEASFLPNWKNSLQIQISLKWNIFPYSNQKKAFMKYQMYKTLSSAAYHCVEICSNSYTSTLEWYFICRFRTQSRILFILSFYRSPEHIPRITGFEIHKSWEFFSLVWRRNFIWCYR